MKFKVVVEKDENGIFFGEVINLPGCYSQGNTLKEFEKNIKEAIELYLEDEPSFKNPKSKFVGLKEVVVNA